MDLMKRINEMAHASALSPDLQDVAQRLAKFWKQKAGNMSDDELSEAIAMDMENVAGIDGDPQIVDQMLPSVMSMVRGG